jgi:predicted HicB family RNase H-like nuclease
MSVMSYKGYSARVEYDDADGVFFGRLAGIRDSVSFHGQSVKELREALHEAVDDYLEAAARIGKAPEKPYSGQIMVRVDPQVHARAALAAELAGKSLAKWTEDHLREDADRELSAVSSEGR